MPLYQSLRCPSVLFSRYPRVPGGAAGVEVASENGPALDQSRHVHVVDRVSTALNSGSIVDVDEPCLPNLLAIRCFPDVEALYVSAIHQVRPLLEHVSVQRLIPYCQCYSRVFLQAWPRCGQVTG